MEQNHRSYLASNRRFRPMPRRRTSRHQLCLSSPIRRTSSISRENSRNCVRRSLKLCSQVSKLITRLRETLHLLRIANQRTLTKLIIRHQKTHQRLTPKIDKLSNRTKRYRQSLTQMGRAQLHHNRKTRFSRSSPSARSQPTQRASPQRRLAKLVRLRPPVAQPRTANT